MLNFVDDFVNNEDGVGVVEIVLILVVLVGLAVSFKGRITTLFGNIFNSIDKQSKDVYKAK